MRHIVNRHPKLNLEHSLLLNFDQCGDSRELLLRFSSQQPAGETLDPLRHARHLLLDSSGPNQYHAVTWVDLEIFNTDRMKTDKKLRDKRLTATHQPVAGVHVYPIYRDVHNGKMIVNPPNLCWQPIVHTEADYHSLERCKVKAASGLPDDEVVMYLFASTCPFSVFVQDHSHKTCRSCVLLASSTPHLLARQDVLMQFVDGLQQRIREFTHAPLSSARTKSHRRHRAERVYEYVENHPLFHSALALPADTGDESSSQVAHPRRTTSAAHNGRGVATSTASLSDVSSGSVGNHSHNSGGGPLPPTAPPSSLSPGVTESLSRCRGRPSQIQTWPSTTSTSSTQSSSSAGLTGSGGREDSYSEQKSETPLYYTDPPSLFSDGFEISSSSSSSSPAPRNHDSFLLMPDYQSNSPGPSSPNVVEEIVNFLNDSGTD